MTCDQPTPSEIYRLLDLNRTSPRSEEFASLAKVLAPNLARYVLELQKELSESLEQIKQLNAELSNNQTKLDALEHLANAIDAKTKELFGEQ